MFDTKLKNFITWTLDFEIIDTKNPGRSVRNELTMTKLILVDPVEDEMLKRLVHGLILQTSYNAI